MKDSDVVLDRKYLTRLDGKPTVVLIEGLFRFGGWYALNLSTNRSLIIKKASQLEREFTIQEVHEKRKINLRNQRLTAERNDLQRRLQNNGYRLGELFEDTIPKEHKNWIARIRYIGRALVDANLPEVP